MRKIDELYADSGEPVKESHSVSRGTALKVGGLGLAGALAAFMPGRAGAAVRKKASNASCQGIGFVCIGGNKTKACGYDNYSLGSCFCGTTTSRRAPSRRTAAPATSASAPHAAARPAAMRRTCASTTASRARRAWRRS